MRTTLRSSAATTTLLALVLMGAAGCGSAAGGTQSSYRGARVLRGLVYEVADGRPVALDAYLPNESRANGAAVMVVHGGAWVAGGRELVAEEASQLALGGFAAFAVDYRLAPGALSPAAVDDVRAAVAWVRGRARSFGVDPTRIGALGISAGGNLVALLATREGAHGAGRLAAAVTWSGPTDLTAAGAAREPALHPYMDSFLGCDPGACPARARAASALGPVVGTPPPMLLTNSTNELVSTVDVVELTDALHRAHGQVDVVILSGSLHAEQYRDHVWSRTVAFLQDHLAAGR